MVFAKKVGILFGPNSTSRCFVPVVLVWSVTLVFLSHGEFSTTATASGATPVSRVLLPEVAVFAVHCCNN